MFQRTMVMEEMETPRDTFVLLRGAYDAPGERVERAVPSIFPPLPDGQRKDRLSFAKWLVDPGNPLSARVAVNRFWQMYFGTGLVKASENFGSQSEPPSHILDDLARMNELKQTTDGLPVHSFRTLLEELATIVRNQVVPKIPGARPFTIVTRPTPLQQQALDRLGVRL